MSDIKNAFDDLFNEQNQGALQAGFTEADMFDICSECGTYAQVVTVIESGKFYEFLSYCRNCYQPSTP